MKGPTFPADSLACPRGPLPASLTPDHTSALHGGSPSALLPPGFMWPCKLQTSWNFIFLFPSRERTLTWPCRWEHITCGGRGLVLDSQHLLRCRSSAGSVTLSFRAREHAPTPVSEDLLLCPSPGPCLPPYLSYLCVPGSDSIPVSGWPGPSWGLEILVASGVQGLGRPCRESGQAPPSLGSSQPPLLETAPARTPA